MSGTPVQSSPPRPPHPSGSTSSHQSSNSNKVSHPSWNSLVSDITMSDEEQQHRHYYQQQNYNRLHQQQAPNYDRGSLERNEDSAASLLEYSHSSEEAYGPRRQHHHNRNSTTTSGSGLFASASSTSFRFRDDHGSSRVVQFETSDEISSDAQEAVEEGNGTFRKNNDDHSRSHQRHKHHSDRGATVNRDTFLSTPNRWVTQLAYSFRTPEAPKQRKKPREEQKQGRNGMRTKKQALSNIHNNCDNKRNTKASSPKPQRTLQSKLQPTTLTVPAQDNSNSENSPLLPVKKQRSSSETFPQQQYHQISQHGHRKLYAAHRRHRHPYDYISIAVAFLQDYEAARPATLGSNVTRIAPWHVGLYRLKYSVGYSILLATATIALFVSSCLEGPSPNNPRLRMHVLTGLNMYSLVIFAMDMWIRSQFSQVHPDQARNSKSLPAQTISMQSRTSQASMLIRPMCLFGLFLGLENIGWLLAMPDRTFVVLYSSIWKPIVLYYISSQARHAMEALMRIARVVSRVLLIEMVLILSFAAVACRLFSDFEPFDHLSVSWLSLFKCKSRPGILCHCHSNLLDYQFLMSIACLYE